MVIKLKEIAPKYKIVQQEFEYAGKVGIAELIGWKIVLFHEKSDLMNTVALSLDEIDDNEMIKIANTILESIDMDIRFGDGIDKIKQKYGVADYTDNIYEDKIRYSYIISPELFMAFGIRDDMLISLEIITDEDIIKERVDVEKTNT